MFESAELGHAIDDATYDAEVPKIREALLAAQSEILAKKEFPVVVLLSGVEAAGKGDTLHVLHEWMDPRYVHAQAFDAPDPVECAHPQFWRFWQALPRAGTTGVFFGAWYRDAMYARIYQEEKRAQLEGRLDAIVRFERMLTDEGALVLKLWLHLSKKQQKEKLKELEADPRSRWRVKRSDWRNHEQYSEFRTVGEEMIRRTSTAHAPWVVIEGADASYRRLTAARVLLDAMKTRLVQAKQVHVHAPPVVEIVDNRKRLRDLDEGASLGKAEYEKRLSRAQGELASLSRKATKAKKATVLVFEGPDAAGKGSTIRRVIVGLDPRHYRVNSFAAPTEEERAFPYLWRFWRKIPRDGDVAIFDRSWYGRTLVERVEGFAPEQAWMRAFSEINDFEADMTEHGAIVVKFWLHITKSEQLKRFREREREGYKRFKITGEDWRNRKKWDAYEQAACDTFDRTSTKHAPWVVVPANDKRYARVTVAEGVVEALRGALRIR